MTMPFTERYQLFKTVADLHSQGKLKLSTTEQQQIEEQTMDLVRKSVLNRTAMAAPEGFEGILMEMDKAPDADAIYGLLVDFLKSQGVIKEEGSLGEKDDVREEGMGLGEGVDNKKPPMPPMGDGPKGPPMDGKPPMGDGPMGDGPKGPKGPPMDDDEPSMDGKPPMGDGPKGPKGPKGPPMGDKKPPMKGKGDSPVDEKDDKMKNEREAVLKRAQEQEHGEISDLQEAARGGDEPVTAEEMGVEDDETTDGPSMSDGDSTMPARAKKIRVAITKSGTLVAQHEDHGPVFHAVPNLELRNNREALRKLANRIYGLAVYQGFAKAAEFCKAKLLIAGVDDDVELDNVEDVEPADDPVTADEETDTREKPEYDNDDVLEGHDNDTREKPDTVNASARRKAVLRRARLEYARRQAEAEAEGDVDAASDSEAGMEVEIEVGDEEEDKSKEGKTAKDDILDEAENVNAEMKPAKPSMDSTDDASTNAQEEHGEGAGDVLADGDNDIRNAHGNYKKLYANRAAKQIAKEKEAFIRKFTKAMRIAGTRMLLNHDEHPFKAAAVDVLSNEGGDIEFSTGEKFRGMDVAAAVDLTELIVSDGHDDFIGALLEKAADLMEKDDVYLADAEADLKALAPFPVDHIVADSNRRPSQRSDRVRREAAEGNFEVDGNNGVPASGPEQKSGMAVIRSALVGGTQLGRRMGRLSRVQGQQR